MGNPKIIIKKREMREMKEMTSLLFFNHSGAL